jgi:predicted O-methyltransferase YrrM
MRAMEDTMTQEQWNAVDHYFNGLFVPADEALDAALQATADAGMPLINVAPNQGKLLYLLARALGVRSILEVGTLGGYSTIWLARALQPGGHLITLEVDPTHAAVARTNIARAGLADTVDVRLGSAHVALPALIDEAAGPFDLVFIDADKPSTPMYVEWALQLTRPGSLIIIDNVVRNGAVSDERSPDAGVQGVRTALGMLAENPRVITSALQTVGVKGYDGLAIALVTGDEPSGRS